MSEDCVRATDAFAMAYLRKRGARLRVRPEVWRALSTAGADMSLYMCDAR
ncbi:hypothetical protein MWN33_13680 [Starkeya koreensis]|uniref:Uncharacterized protein n=1 Tax=Ancylobacter koreensis TaxID=266121 RepID=A0ABT0DP77_9HYPH|nr:hypothetical protein [Ancylobacter koreensis]MCK0209081.1 hypothetical protein [Ancylobacter koreensis]